MSTPHGSLRSTFLVQLIRASILYGSLVCISAGRDGRGRGKDRRRNNEIPLIQSSSKGKDRRRNNGIPLTQSPSNASSLEVFGREHHAAPPFVPASALGRSGADAAFALVASGVSGGVPKSGKAGVGHRRMYLYGGRGLVGRGVQRAGDVHGSAVL